MPTYIYEVIATGERFEIVQRMSEEALSEHPESGVPVRRVFVPPNLGTKHTTGKEKSMLENKNVEKAGFTKYEKDKLTGQYHRVAGKKGPDTLL